MISGSSTKSFLVILTVLENIKLAEEDQHKCKQQFGKNRKVIYNIEDQVCMIIRDRDPTISIH